MTDVERDRSRENAGRWRVAGQNTFRAHPDNTRISGTIKRLFGETDEKCCAQFENSAHCAVIKEISEGFVCYSRTGSLICMYTARYKCFEHSKILKIVAIGIFYFYKWKSFFENVECKKAM